ncbi:MAG: outer membrane beta-barrel protein [Legionellaceae bacterium]|nr:outer membrane beta-barrel protein [Legionellaceae bacterium]
MTHLRVLSIAATMLTCIQASAGTMGPVGPQQSWVATISAGPVWARGGKTQTFFLDPAIEKTYTVRKSSNALASGELFVGMQWALSSRWLGQMGLAVAASGNARVRGEIWDDADPEFNNYLYQYKVRNTRIAVKGKLLYDKGYWAMPWVSASLGAGRNRAHRFTNTPVIFEALANPNFTNHSRTAFTYTLGAGLQTALNEHWQVGLGYEFADWGKSALGRADGQTRNSGPKLNHLYTNGVLLNLTYLA